MNKDIFTLTNFYIFLIEFGFSLLFLLVFASIHYGLIKSTRLGTKLEKSKVLNFWYFFLFGFILSLITFIVSQVSSLAIGAIGMPLTILGLIYAMTIFYNRSVQVGAIIPTILWILYQYNGFIEFNFDWLIRVIVILIMAIIAIATTFIKWKPWPTFLLSCLTTLVSMIIVILAKINEYSLYYSVVCLIAIVVTIFYYAVIRSVNKWLTHMSTMARQGAYIDKHYLIPTVLDQYFNEFIKKNNCSQALVVTFVINGDEQHKTLVLDKIHSLFQDDKSLFFKSTYETYGVVLFGKNYFVNNLKLSFDGNTTLSRQETDNLKTLENKLNKIKFKNTSLSAYVSIYGVHSCNLDSLLKRNNYAIKHDNHEPKQNIIQIFHTNMTTQDISDEISFATLNQKINLNDINVELELIQMKKTKAIYVCPRFFWAKMLTCNIADIMGKFETSVANALLRHLAIKSLEAYANNTNLQKHELILYYPIDQLNNTTWSCISLMKKIKMFGVNPKNVILSFNVKKYKDFPNLILDNLVELELHDIHYFLIDVINTDAFKYIHPEGIVVAEQIANKPSTFKILKQYKQVVL